MGASENESAVIFDIIGELYMRGLDVFVERVLAFTDGKTVSSCFRVCSSWEKHLRNGKVWRRIVERMFAENPDFRLLCRLNGWLENLPSQGGCEVSEDEYKQIVYKVTNYEEIWTKERLSSSKLFTGGLFSCLKLHQQCLFAGMIDGLIKMWDLSQDYIKKPMKIFEGHEERVSSIDAQGELLVSGSLDHSVRVWNIETSSMLRVLRGSGSPIHMVTIFPDHLAWCSRSGTFQVWSWKGPDKIEPKERFKIVEDPSKCLICISAQFIVVALNDGYSLSDREVVVYNSQTGKQMVEKDIFASASIKCMSIQNHLLFIGAGSTVEIWNVENSKCLAVLGSAFNPSPNQFVKNMCVSSFQLVAMLANGSLFHWPLHSLIKQEKKGATIPLHADLEMFSGFIENKEPAWKSLVMSDNRVVFGLEMKFGDVKILRWSKNAWRFMDVDEDSTAVSMRRMPSFTYRFDCTPECPQCQVIDLK